jgi:type IV secretory pathway TraG/TraD family ATPase VirD4
LPGADNLHPKTNLPPSWYVSKQDRVFAVSTDGKTNLSISAQDSLEHTVILGPTGSGKSTAMQNLILSDIRAGRSVLVIDPKSDLVGDILARIPENRDGELVIIDPSDPCPAGFNPLAFKNRHSPNLTADAVLAVFQEVFKENWGIRSQDVLSSALLTLAQSEGASLLWLPPLLTDGAFRKKITSGVRDKIGLEPYWSSFDAMKDSERKQEIAPVLNKLRQFLLRPGLRNVLGQSSPKFDLNDLFSKSRVVLVPLNKGLIGAESAKLLGSLIVGLTWTLALSRAGEPAGRRRLVSIYIDELQDYLALPTDLSDALAQARGLGVGLTLAHQYREQLPPNIRAGVDANARNKIIFGLSSGDAKDMSAMAPELEAADFMSLPRYHVYASFQQNGRNSGWLSGRTFRPPPASRPVKELREKSMAAFGKPAGETEAEYLQMLAGLTGRSAETEEPPETVGRRKRM